MRYAELKKRIKAEQAEKEYEMYIAYMTDYRSNKESLISNFIDDCSTITDDQLIKAEADGLLIKDWDTYLVVKK